MELQVALAKVSKYAVRKSGDTHVRLNIETKIDPNHPDESPDPQRFVELLLALLDAEKFSDRVMVQSFDWRTLQLVQQRVPAIPSVYLTQQAGSGATIALAKASPWTAGFNPGEHRKSLPRTIRAEAWTGGGCLDREQSRRHGADDRHGH